MAANAFIWTCYGLLLNESKIWIANGVGFLLSLYYCARFIKFAPKAAPTLPGTVSQHVRFATALIAATAMMSLSPLRSKTKIIGLSGVVVCSALFMSPLAALKTVLDTKSAKSIPLPLSLATIANGLLWTTVGALELHDANVVIPSALGLASGIAQLVLKLIYGNSKPNVYPVPI
jgi:solute carrier family 50 protein (sugar transporter)